MFDFGFLNSFCAAGLVCFSFGEARFLVAERRETLSSSVSSKGDSSYFTGFSADVLRLRLVSECDFSGDFDSIVLEVLGCDSGFLREFFARDVIDGLAFESTFSAVLRILLAELLLDLVESVDFSWGSKTKN